jgi:hypothetical protein
LNLEKRKIQNNLDDKQLAKMRKFLESKRNSDIGYMIERFVGILRGEEQADRLSIKIYL